MSHSITARIGVLTALALLLSASPAVAHDHATIGDHPGDDHAVVDEQADDDEAFEQMVQSIDILPDRETLEERWPDADERLIEMARDTDRTEFERWRATSLLGNFSGSEVEQTLLELTDDELPRVRAMAYYTLGTAFLQEGDDELFSTLESGLDDDNERVPVQIVRSFGWTNHPEAIELLEQIAEDDSDEDLASHAERALQRHER